VDHADGPQPSRGDPALGRGRTHGARHHGGPAYAAARQIVHVPPAGGIAALHATPARLRRGAVPAHGISRGLDGSITLPMPTSTTSCEIITTSV
jgi:hypothetical protein